MKIILRGFQTLLALLVGATAHAQAPSWQSVTTTTNVTTPAVNFPNSYIRAAATDASGNIFVVGAYVGSITLGTINLVPTVGYGGLFVAKWSPATNAFVWVQQASGVSANAIAVSGNNIYIGGYTGYGPFVLGGTTFAAGASDTGFIAKLTDGGGNGSFVWAQQLGGRSYDGIGVMGLAASGNSVYATGSFVTSTATFGAYTLTNTSTAVPRVSEEIYLTKLTDAGATASVAWVQQAPASSGAKTGWPYSVTTSGSNVYMTGRGPQAFVVKFTDAGSFQWVSTFGGTYALNNGLTIPASLTARGSDLYVAGRFTGSAPFGSTTLAQPAGAAPFSSDIFVTKLHDNGASATQGWALQAGGTDTDSATAIVASPNGLYVAGMFRGPAASFGSTTLASAGDGDVYVSRIVENGSGASFAWALPAGGSSVDRAQGLALSGSSLYAVGHAVLPAQFGALATPTGSSNALVGFLARITDVVLPTRSTTSLAASALYPNPAHGTTTVRMPAGKGAATFTLFDGLGRPVRTQLATTDQDYSLDLAGLAPGVYALRVQAGAAVATQKLVVE